MKLRPVFFLILAAVCLGSCHTTEMAGGTKKKKRPALSGEEESEIPWNRATRQSEVGTPFGLPTSH